MSDDRPLADIKRYTEETLDREGVSSLGVGLPSRENQALRFDQVLRLIEPEEGPFTINDLGCGFADRYGRIRERGLPMSGYRGYDLSEKMLEIARTNTGEDAELVHGDRIDRPADYSIGCGIFNTRLEADEGDWLDYMKDVVRNLAAHSTRGCAFNSLTTYVDYREPHLFYVDPSEMFDFCKREISPRVSLLHDYPLWEWTMIVRTAESDS
jgi:SAM-dependent methyltransferase